MELKQTASALMASLVLAGAVSVPALAAEDHLVIAPAPEAEYGYSLEVNGQQAEVTVPVMVPLRAVAEALGFTVTWNGDGTVLIDSGLMHSTITLGVDSYQAVTSLEDAEGATGSLSLGAGPVVIGNSTYVPLELFDILLGNGAVALEDGKITVNTAVQIPNPWVELDSLAAAERTAGFDLTLPAAVEDYEETAYQVLPAGDGTILEVLCRNGEERLTFRKGPGTEDVSGDYTVYEWEETTQIGGLSVTVRGSGGLAFLAVWTDGTFSFSLSDPSGLEKSELLALISAPAE